MTCYPLIKSISALLALKFAYDGLSSKGEFFWVFKCFTAQLCFYSRKFSRTLSILSTRYLLRIHPLPGREPPATDSLPSENSLYHFYKDSRLTSETFSASSNISNIYWRVFPRATQNFTVTCCAVTCRNVIFFVVFIEHYQTLVSDFLLMKQWIAS